MSRCGHELGRKLVVAGSCESGPIHSEGHRSGDDPGDADVKDSPAREGAESLDGGGGKLGGPSQPKRTASLCGRACPTTGVEPEVDRCRRESEAITPPIEPWAEDSVDR